MKSPEQSPWRKGCAVEPLIEASAMFPALEELVIDAEKTVDLAFRLFDPSTKTRSRRAEELGLKTWLDIFRHVVERGVTLRLLLTDFEPVVAHHLHAQAWETYHALSELNADMDEDERARLQLVCVLHEGEFGLMARWLFWLPVRRRLSRLLRKLNKLPPEERRAQQRYLPGTWPLAIEKQRSLRPRGLMPPRMWPATHHQKFAVADNEVAILGGLDVNERRYDDPRHRQEARETWHDISCRVKGPVVKDIAQHFREMWNAEVDRFLGLTSEWERYAEHHGQRLQVGPLKALDEEPAAPPPAGDARARFVRTKSRRIASPFAFGPQAEVTEIARAIKSLIASAERFIYIESQFFRYLPLSRWLIDRARRAPDLQVIILLPFAPEEVAFGKMRNSAMRYGEWLQARALLRLRRGVGRRLGLFSLVKDEPASKESGRAEAYGSGVIHVHSKMILVDDQRCMISSANLNGRSLKWDTEAGIMWHDAEGIRALRLKLWHQLLWREDIADWEPENFTERWRLAAAQNAKSDPANRSGFVVPYQVHRALRFGRPTLFLPDDML